MNKRQIKKQQKKIDVLLETVLEDIHSHCEGCGKKLNRDNKEYHAFSRFCSAKCYLDTTEDPWSELI